MSKLKVLNLYAGIGGNRKLWENVQVTAVELDPEIAKIYQSYFPDDIVIVGDAHQYLLDHYKEFDFIWASPPCPSHSQIRKINTRQNKAIYPDMDLYAEILLLDNYFDGIYCVENVTPFYKPLIPGHKIDRHLFWTNFLLGQFETSKENVIDKITTKTINYGFDLSGKKTKKRKDQILRNIVNPETGLYILNCARNIITKSNIEQIDLFE